jgi:hypothetical protein
MNVLKYKPSITKSTGQIKISLRKKTLPKKLLADLPKIKSIKMQITGWDCEDGS